VELSVGQVPQVGSGTGLGKKGWPCGPAAGPGFRWCWQRHRREPGAVAAQHPLQLAAGFAQVSGQL